MSKIDWSPFFSLNAVNYILFLFNFVFVIIMYIDL